MVGQMFLATLVARLVAGFRWSDRAAARRGGHPASTEPASTGPASNGPAGAGPEAGLGPGPLRAGQQRIGQQRAHQSGPVPGASRPRRLG